MMCVTPQVYCLFLSQRAFKELHVVSKNFPAQVAGTIQVTETGQVAKCTATDNEDNDGRGCDCPARTEVPEPPRWQPKVSPRELEEIIKNPYASSALNTCKRQKLPVMENAPPCQLLWTPSPEPSASTKLGCCWCP